MLSESMSASRLDGSPTKYNLKVMERKLQAQTDWAELIRKQQTLAEQMEQQEKELKMKRKMEMNESLAALVNEKQNQKYMESSSARQQEYLDSLAKKQEYDHYLMKVKNDKNDIQKNLSAEYERNRLLKEEEKRKKTEYERQTEQRMVQDALDSLQKEKYMKDMKKSAFRQSIDDLLREKEQQKRKEQEQMFQSKADQNRLFSEDAQSYQRKMMEKQQKLMRADERQNYFQQMHDQRVTEAARSKERKIEDFVNKGIEESRRRAEEEEYAKQIKKQQQIQMMAHNVRSKIQENQEEQWRQKMSYHNKVEDLLKQNIQMQEYEQQVKINRANKTNEYRNTLENQIREAESKRLKLGTEMSESERKLHLNQFNGLLPGMSSTRLDALVSPHMRSNKLITFPQNGGHHLGGSQGDVGLYQNDVSGSKSLENSMSNSLLSPTSPQQKFEKYNPITNPVPNTLQNPYLIKEFQREGFSNRNRLAVIANRNL